MLSRKKIVVMERHVGLSLMGVGTEDSDWPMHVSLLQMSSTCSFMGAGTAVHRLLLNLFTILNRL